MLLFNVTRCQKHYSPILIRLSLGFLSFFTSQLWWLTCSACVCMWLHSSLSHGICFWLLTLTNPSKAIAEHLLKNRIKAQSKQLVDNWWCVSALKICLSSWALPVIILLPSFSEHLEVLWWCDLYGLVACWWCQGGLPAIHIHEQLCLWSCGWREEEGRATRPPKVSQAQSLESEASDGKSSPACRPGPTCTPRPVTFPERRWMAKHEQRNSHAAEVWCASAKLTLTFWIAQ